MENEVEQAAASSVHSESFDQEKSSRKCFGLLTRRPRWGLSGRGWLVGVLVLAVAAGSLLFGVHPFLAITLRAPVDVLVVEGWVHEYAIRAAVAELKSGSYPQIFSTGGPVNGSGGYINDQNTSASVGAGLLKRVGVPDEVVQMVPSRVSGQDRTYSSAVALRDWFRQRNKLVRSINVVTEGAHARRSRLLFQKAFGDDVTVGIIAVPSPDYDEQRWWRYSEGVREVIGEGIAYVYAKFLFWPPGKAEN